MENKTITLTVGIPAFNEGNTLRELLLQIVSQKQDNYICKDIIVYSDCSSDNTNKIVTALSKKYPKIKLIKGKERKGKYYRVNELFAMCKTDGLVILDADIALVGDNFLNNLAKALIKDPGAQLVAAHQVLIKPKNLIGKIVYAYFTHADYIRWSIPNYDSGVNYFGTGTIYRGSFARSVKIPQNLLDPHLFIYLMAEKMHGFRYCHDAVLLQVPITKVVDLEKYLRRSIGKEDKQLEKIFGERVKTVYKIPRRYKVIGTIKSFIHEPFLTPLGMLLAIYMEKRVRDLKQDNTPVWDIVTSTKTKINTKDYPKKI